MKYYAGLDVSLELTNVCLVDDTGKIVSEAKVSSEPEALLNLFSDYDCLARIGLEAGPLSQWLHEALANAGMPVICVETRHMKAALSAMVNKTDRNDARGIAQMMRVGLYRPVHVKTLASQEARMLLTNRKFVVHRLRDTESQIRGTLRNFGLKVGPANARVFEQRVLDLVRGRKRLQALVVPMLRIRSVLLEEYDTLHTLVLSAVRGDPVCCRLMTVPGVGPITALTFRATVDVPARFAKSKAVGAHFGLAPRKYQSGEIDRTGHISKCGDQMMRCALYEAANCLLVRVRRKSWLKTWALNVARRRGLQKAKVALARRLAVILHRIWMDGSEFCCTRERATAQ